MEAKRLRELLSYDPETGEFRWLVSRKGVRKTKAAGHLADGYVLIRIDQRLFKAHRLAWLYMTGEWPSDQIDHINRCRSDNRWCNIRVVTNKQNHENIPVYSSNTSGYPGVRWDKSRNKWFAYINHNGLMRSLGRHEEMGSALAARRAAEKELFTHA